MLPTGAGSELLSKTFTVTPALSTLNFWYAVVFQDPGHALVQQPSFWVRVTETSTGNVISGAVNLGNGSSKIVAQSSDPFLQTSPTVAGVVYRNWTCAQINLASQVGKTVTIEFVTEDCAQGAHYGYAYIDNLCGTCAGSPAGNVAFNSQSSSNCGPGTLCFNYDLPQAPTGTGTVRITLTLLQNGAVKATYLSPILSSGNSYCFNINPSGIAGLNSSLGGFDFVATGNFTIGTTTLAPITVATSPAGVQPGNNNDYQIACPAPGNWCCPGNNLVTNGNFEAGNSGFTSQYIYNPTVAAGATVAGQYNVVTGNGSQTISPYWVAADHATCQTGSGRFLVVNGRTGQAGYRTIWKQTVPVAPGKEYRFCANLRNLPQCTFNVKPVVKLVLNVANSIIPTSVALTGSNPCNWQLLSGDIYIPAGVTSLTLDLQLREIGPGDGNDLAVDDISLQEKTAVNPAYTAISLSTSQPANGQYNVKAFYPAGLPGFPYGYLWQVCELDNNNNPVPGTTVSNPAAWWTYTGPVPAGQFNDFKGYNGTGALTSPPTLPGKFLVNKRYRITFGVWSDCQALRVSSWILQFAPAMAPKPQVKPLVLQAGQLKIQRPEIRRQWSLTVPPSARNAGTKKELVSGANGAAYRGRESNPLARSVSLGPSDAARLPRAEETLTPGTTMAVGRPLVRVGQAAPDFAARDAAGKIWRLNDLRGRASVLLTFFPKCFTGGCANHLASLRDYQKEWEARGVQVLAVSVDEAQGERGQLAFARQWGLTFPLIPDTERRLCKLYGAAQEDNQLAARMTVFIDRAGVVRLVDTDVQVHTYGADMLARIKGLPSHD